VDPDPFDLVDCCPERGDVAGSGFVPCAATARIQHPGKKRVGGMAKATVLVTISENEELALALSQKCRSYLPRWKWRRGEEGGGAGEERQRRGGHVRHVMRSSRDSRRRRDGNIKNESESRGAIRGAADGGITADEDISEDDRNELVSSDESSLTAATPDHPPEAEDEDGVVSMPRAQEELSKKQVNGGGDEASAGGSDGDGEKSMKLSSVIVKERSNSQLEDTTNNALETTASPSQGGGGSSRVLGSDFEIEVEGEEAPKSGGLRMPVVVGGTTEGRGALSPALLSQIKYSEDDDGRDAKGGCRCTVS
jgi:hypothetical protein